MEFLALLEIVKKWSSEEPNVDACKLAYTAGVQAIPLTVPSKSAEGFIDMMAKGDGLRIIGYTTALKIFNKDLFRLSTSPASMLMLALTVACRDWQNGCDRFTGSRTMKNLTVEQLVNAPLGIELVTFAVKALGAPPLSVMLGLADDELAGVGVCFCLENDGKVPESVEGFNAEKQMKTAMTDFAKEDLSTLAVLNAYGLSKRTIAGYAMARYYMKWSRAQRPSENLAAC